MKTETIRAVQRAVSVTICAAAVFVFSLMPVYAVGEDEPDSGKENAVGWFETVPIDLFGERVAPGSQGEHQFSIRNTSDFALDYELVFYGADGAIPMRYRIRSGNEYVIGSRDDWEVATVLENATKTSGTIPYGGKLDLTIEWWWPFETGNDELDTEVGISAPDEMFYIAMLGTGRDSNSAPVIIRSDFVEIIKPQLYPLVAVAFGTAAKIAFSYYYKLVTKRKE